MTDDPNPPIPEPARKIIDALIAQAFARCDRLGIAREDFYRAMLEEQKIPQKVSVPELLERTFRRLGGASN
jgi:hypothetical protein